ncbi:NAD(P)H-binding protein [Kitasatospora sp. NPDC048540]|uniref:NAD(P)H-binding protein n=1 Tax=unclassified Kitasatospora TaxID=2633591 RepID=UPI0009E8BCD3|nr:NAD(P)H-binding protein [Kitasatospora sp. MBT63]
MPALFQPLSVTDRVSGHPPSCRRPRKGCRGSQRFFRAPRADAVVFAAGAGPNLKAKRAAEEAIRDRPLDWTILRPAALVDTPTEETARRVGAFGGGAVDQRCSWRSSPAPVASS